MQAVFSEISGEIEAALKMALIGAIVLALCVGAHASFDSLDEDGLIPSDGFHDLLGLVPFWMVDRSSVALRRTLGVKRDNLPSNWNEIASQNGGDRVYTIAGTCSLQGSFSGGKAVLKVKAEGSCTKPSLKVIFTKLFPSVKVAETTENFILPDKFDFEELEIVTATREVTVKAAAKDSWGISERRLLLGDAKLTLGFTAGQEIRGVKDWKIHVVGSIGVSTHSVTMTIDKPKGKVGMPFTWEITSVLMADLLGIFGITMDYFKFNDIGFDSTKLEGVTFNGAEMKGILNPDESYQIVCKASVSNSKALKSGDVYLILSRPAGQVTKPAIIIDIRDIFNIGEALEVFIRQSSFISDFGMIGRIERDCIIMLAKEEITMVDDEEINKLIKAFVTEHDTKQIPKGVNVRVMVPMKDNMKKECSASANIDSAVPEILPITISIKAGGLGFKYPDKFKADLPSMLKCLDSNIAAELPSQLFPKPDGPINIKEMTIASRRYVKITVVLNGPFTFLGGKITISDLELTVEWQRGEELKFSGVTTVTVGPLAVGLTLEKQGNSYSLSAYIESFKLNQLEELIGPSTFTNFMKLLGSLDGFGIKDFKLIKNFGKGSDSALRVSGSPILWGWENASIEGLVWYPKNKGNGQQPDKAVAVGIVIEGIRLDKLMEKIFGDNLFKTAWFSEMVAIVIISNAHAKVEASSDNDGKSKANDIGNKDKILGGDASSKQPDERTIYDELTRNKFTIARYVRDVKPVAKITPIIKNKLARKLISSRDAQQKRLRQGLPLGNATLANKGHQMPIRHSTGARRAKDKKGDKGKGPSDGKKEEEGAEGEEKKEEEKEEEEEEEMKFKIPYLSSQDITPGLSFVGIFNIPQDNGCKGDALCLWLGETVGRDATIEISGTITKTSFAFGAKFAGSIPLVPGKLNMQSIELKVTLDGLESSVRIECTLYWSDKEILGTSQLQLMGAVEVSLTGKLSLEFNMIDIWRKPFGFQYLAFGNLHLAIGMSVGVPLPSFEFGAEVWIGQIKDGTNDHAIKVAGYFGVDPNKPQDNYVYASISAFTLDSVFKAFELGTPDMPKFVRETGFPEGITVAYSLKGKTIDALDIEIGAGLYLKGTINFLGYTVAAEIIINPPEKFLVDIQLSPIDWAGGLIALRRSSTDKKNGPKAFIYITKTSVTVQIEGYISLLGMSRYVYIDVSDTAFKFRTDTDLWGIIKSTLYVEAAYGSLATLNFEFRASIEVNFDKIFAAVKEYLHKAAETAKKKILEAEEKVRQSKTALTNARSKMQGWRSKVDEYKNYLQRKSDEIEASKKNMQNDCRRECGKVCIPFLDWKSRCFKVLWWWVGCPYWNSCRWRVDNVICIAGCEIKKLANKFVAWATQLGIKILMGFADVAKGLISVGEGFVSLAEKVVDFAADFLHFVHDIVAAGSKVLAEITDWAAKNLFKIDLLELNGKLDNDFNACVGLKVKCVIIGININFEGQLCINLNFFKQLAMIVSEKKYPGLQKMDNRLDEIESKKEDLEKNQEDVKKEEQEIESDVKKETSLRAKRDHVPTEREMYYLNLATERLPPVVTRGPETIAAFKNDAPWVLIKDFDSRNFDHTPHQDEDIPAEKRMLDENWEEHASSPCTQIKKVLDKYSMITDGLTAVHDSLRDIREGYQSTKRTMQQGVDSLKSEIDLTEMKHNMTHEEREDLYHWYNEAKDGLESWDKKASGVLKNQRKMAIPTFHSQINHILMKEKNTDFHGYMHELHTVGQAASKRSTIPNGDMEEAANELHKIKRDLVRLVSNEDADPLLFGRQVRSIRSNIKGVKRTMKKCK